MMQTHASERLVHCGIDTEGKHSRTKARMSYAISLLMIHVAEDASVSMARCRWRVQETLFMI